MDKNSIKKPIYIRFGIFIIVFTGLSFFINSIFHNFPIYKNLIIPDTFKPIYSGMIGKVGVICFILFILLNRKKIMELKIEKYKLNEIILFSFLTVLILIVYYSLRWFIKLNLEFATKYIWIFIPLLYLLILSYGVAIFLAVFGKKFLKDSFKKFKYQVFPFLLGAFLIYGLLTFVQSLWYIFSYGVGTILFNIFKLLYDNVTFRYHPTGPVLSVQGFSAGIGAQCSGIDSLMMFVGLFTFIYILDYHKINIKRMLIFFVIGILGTYLFNITRIFLLYLTGIYISPDFAVGLFHQNVGWILFIVYFFIFWLIASKFVYKKTFKKNRV